MREEAKMKTAMRKSAARMLALLLSAVLLMGMVPVSAAGNTSNTSSSDDFSRIVHLDMGRKYFTAEWIKNLIDEMAKLGYNQLELDFGNSEAGQLRFALSDMSVTYTYEEQQAVPIVETPVTEVTPGLVEPSAEVSPSTQPSAEVSPSTQPSAEVSPSTQPSAEVSPSTQPSAEVSPSAQPSSEVDETIQELLDNPSVMNQTVGMGGVTEITYQDVAVTKTVDLSSALGEAITESEMKDIISHAQSKGIEIVPLLNSPGHFGAVLCAADAANKDFRYQGSNSLDITDPEARAFGQAVVLKYAEWFKEKGCTTFNIGADEFANDIYSSGGMGFAHLVSAEKYAYFVSYINTLADKLQDMGYTVRAFNDGINYGGQTGVENDIQVCYWTSGWDGYNVASASELADNGFTLINTHGDYYYVLGKGSPMTDGKIQATDFEAESFIDGSTIANPAGAMFCIWSDYPEAVQDEDDVMTGALPYMTGFASKIAASATAKDNATGISVTAPGVTKVTVTADETVAALAGRTYVAYDMKPETAAGAYTGAAEVTIPLGDLAKYDDSNLTGFVVEDGSISEIPGTKNGDNYTFTMPHFSVGGVMLVNEEYDDIRTITVSVGKTVSDTIEGVNYAGEYSTADPHIATVTVTGTNGSETSVSYEEASDLLSENIKSWKATGYYYKNGSDYYPLYAKRSSSWGEYTYTWGYSKTNSASNVTQIGTESTRFPNWTGPNITVYTQSTMPGTEASTTVSITGVREGETSVVIGNKVKYNITVTKADLSQVDPLTVEYWITNRQVTADGATSMEIAASSAYGENGVAIEDFIPATGIGEGNDMDYWKTTRLDSNHQQTEDGGVDQTKSGTDFTYIRYWEDAWWYSANGTSWTKVLWNDQIVAYYLQRTEVTQEVTTQVVDWGPQKNEWGGLTYLGDRYVLVDYSVKYESGEEVPSSFPTDQSLGFHCESGSYRTLGMIRAQETADYEVYLITLTPTSDREKTRLSGSTAAANTHYSYSGTEVVAWAATEEDLTNSGLGTYTSISGAFTYSVGGDPIVSGLEIYRQHGMKVTYYVRAKATEDALTVHYIDNASSSEFYSYNIAVWQGTVFNEGFALVNGSLINNTVTNKLGNSQTVSTNLSTLPQISAQYQYSDYSCVKAERSDDGKEVYLYYTFNNTHSFVVDFGLPVTITLSDLGIDTSSTNIASAEMTGSIPYGTAVATTTGFTYTPTNILKGTVTLHYTLTDVNETSITHVVYLYPASTVYYEAEDQSFVSYTGTWSGDSQSGNQQTEKLGISSNYGSDSHYANASSQQSNGAAKYVTVSSADSSNWPTASFTFTGTGADIISQTDRAAGIIAVTVTDTKNAGLERKYLVNNYYGYTYNNGKWTPITGGSNANGIDSIYQVPVIHIDDLAYGTYEVEIQVFYDKIFDVAGKMDFTFALDAIRVYNPLENSSVYADDGETNPTFVSLHDKVTNFGRTGTLVDGLKEANLDLFKTVGPNNEIYLASGQSVTIDLNQSATSGQIGARLIGGTSATLNIGGKSVTVDSTVEQYYTIGSGVDTTVTITNNGDGTVALTTLKLFGVRK